jgi:hypothetical protein
MREKIFSLFQTFGEQCTSLGEILLTFYYCIVTAKRIRSVNFKVFFT